MKICFKKVGVGTDVAGNATYAAIQALDCAGEDHMVCSVHGFYEAVADCRQELVTATVYCPRPDEVDLALLQAHMGGQSVRVTLGGAAEESREPACSGLVVAVAVTTVQVEATRQGRPATL